MFLLLKTLDYFFNYFLIKGLNDLSLLFDNERLLGFSYFLFEIAYLF